MTLPQSSDDPTPSNTRLAQIALNGLFLKIRGGRDTQLGGCTRVRVGLGAVRAWRRGEYDQSASCEIFKIIEIYLKIKNRQRPISIFIIPTV